MSFLVADKQPPVRSILKIKPILTHGFVALSVVASTGLALNGTRTWSIYSCGQFAENITEVNRGASATGTASTQVLSSAQSLSKESHHLKLEVDKFLNTVRAA